jgi:hypothetical protein
VKRQNDATCKPAKDAGLQFAKLSGNGFSTEILEGHQTLDFAENFIVQPTGTLLAKGTCRVEPGGKNNTQKI